MIRLEDVMGLASFKERVSYVTSFYLGFGEGAPPKKLLLSAKALLKEGHAAIQRLPAGEEATKSLSLDLGKIERYFKKDFERSGTGGIAIFSSSAHDFFKTFFLKAPVKDRIVMKRSFYVRPLTLILDDFKRCIVVLVDRAKARVFEAHLGEMLAYIEITDEVPKQVKEAGYRGYEEKRIHRHIEDHVQKHYKRVARQLLDLFKMNRFERLILGGTPEALGEFEKQLHSYLRENVIGRFSIESGAPIIEVFQKSKTLAEQLERQSEEKLVRDLIDTLWPQGRGTLGIDGTVEALMRGEVYSLLVAVGFVRPGYACRVCGYVSVREKTCSLCESEMEAVPDVVDEMILETVRQRAHVHHISGIPEFLDKWGVGARLRFRV
jgi:peptide chain release factor subunit 1